MDSELLLGSEGLHSVSLVGGRESPRVGDILLRPGEDETFGPMQGTPWVGDDNVRFQRKKILRGRNHYVWRGRKWALGHLRHGVWGRALERAIPLPGGRWKFLWEIPLCQGVGKRHYMLSLHLRERSCEWW